MNNRGEEGGQRSVNVAAGQPNFASNQNFRSGRIRCGAEGHNWRRFHSPFQKTLAFPSRNGPPPTGSEKALISHGWNDAESMPRVEKALQKKEIDNANDGSKNDIPTTTIEKMTESEWIERRNAHPTAMILMVEIVFGKCRAGSRRPQEMGRIGRVCRHRFGINAFSSRGRMGEKALPKRKYSTAGIQCSGFSIWRLKVVSEQRRD